MPCKLAGILVVSADLGILKVTLWVAHAGALTSVPVLPTLKPLLSLAVTSLTISYLSVGSVGSASCNANLVTFFIFFFFIWSLINSVTGFLPTKILCSSANFVTIVGAPNRFFV